MSVHETGSPAIAARDGGFGDGQELNHGRAILAYVAFVVLLSQVVACNLFTSTARARNLSVVGMVATSELADDKASYSGGGFSPFCVNSRAEVTVYRADV